MSDFNIGEETGATSAQADVLAEIDAKNTEANKPEEKGQEVAPEKTTMESVKAQMEDIAKKMEAVGMSAQDNPKHKALAVELEKLLKEKEAEEKKKAAAEDKKAAAEVKTPYQEQCREGVERRDELGQRRPVTSLQRVH